MKKMAAALTCLAVLVMQFTTAYAGLIPKSSDLFGEFMPCIAYAIGREPDDEVQSDAGLTQTYQGFKDSDYVEFCKYLGDRYTAVDQSVEDGVATLTVANADGTSIVFSYDRNQWIATMTYPQGTRVEEAASASSSKSNNMPLLRELFGEDVIPSLSTAIGRPVDSIEDSNSLVRETFNNFTIEEYETYSAYLAECGCYVEDSSVVNNVMNVKLKKGDTGFVFIYDYAANTAVVEYAQGTSSEPVITPTPVPTAAPTASPTPKPKNPQNDCYRIAYNYFINRMNSSLNNPSSLVVHGHTVGQQDGEYIFVFDYSAQNALGGMTRKKYLVAVDMTTYQVTASLNS